MGPDLTVGAELAGYRVEALLGRGGMGVVYLAQDLHLHRQVVLKVLAPELSGDEQFRRRFVRESHLAASMDHPNIIPIYQAGEADAMLYIAMRYVRGTDLRALLHSEQRLDVPRTLSIVGQVARALDAAHAHGLVHRDVKPGNILLTAEPGEGSDHVYLTDFGLTKLTGSDSGITGSGMFVGTVPYVAPEQIQGEHVDSRADIYALGCVLFECLSGRVPFLREEDVAVLFAHITEPIPRISELRPELPIEIDDVLTRAMAKNREARYTTGSAMMMALRAAIEGASPSTDLRRLEVPVAPRSEALTLAPGQPIENPEATLGSEKDLRTDLPAEAAALAPHLESSGQDALSSERTVARPLSHSPAGPQELVAPAPPLEPPGSSGLEERSAERPSPPESRRPRSRLVAIVAASLAVGLVITAIVLVTRRQGVGPGAVPSATSPPVVTASLTPSESAAAGAIQGPWDGTWTSTNSPANGTFHIDFTQSGIQLNGSITITNTPCITTGTITGALAGNRITFGAVQGAQTIAYTGTISGTSMSGTYAAPQCGNGTGNWHATKA
jgi:serine/threonine protein kinase